MVKKVFLLKTNQTLWKVILSDSHNNYLFQIYKWNRKKYDITLLLQKNIFLLKKTKQTKKQTKIF